MKCSTTKWIDGHGDTTRRQVGLFELVARWNGRLWEGSVIIRGSLVGFRYVDTKEDAKKACEDIMAHELKDMLQDFGEP